MGAIMHIGANERGSRVICERAVFLQHAEFSKMGACASAVQANMPKKKEATGDAKKSPAEVS
jgi:hypothetical protein